MTNLPHCLAYLAKLPPAVSGSGGHNATLRAACECVRFGLTDSEAMQALAEYNRRCSPQWSERELAHKLADARKLAGGQTSQRARSVARKRRESARTFDRAALDRALAQRRARRAVETRYDSSPTLDTPGDATAFVARSTPPVARATDPASAMRAAFALIEAFPGYLPGVPIARQSIEVEERYWAEVWQRMGVPDPAILRLN